MRLEILGRNEDWDRGICQAEGPRKPWESGENEGELGPWKTVRQDSRGAEEENRGIETVGNQAGTGAWDTGRTNCEKAHGEKEQKKNKMLA